MDFDDIDIKQLAPLLNKLIKKETDKIKKELNQTRGWTGTVASVNAGNNTVTVTLTGDTRGDTSDIPNKTNQSLTIGDYVHISSFTGELSNSWIDIVFKQYV